MPPSDDQEQGLDIGKILNTARIHHRLSIDDVSEALRIRRDYLQALEQNRWEDLPGEVYGQGFLRSYGRFVDLDGDKLVELRRSMIGAPTTKTVVPDGGTTGKGTGIFTHPGAVQGSASAPSRSQKVRPTATPRSVSPQPMSSRSVITLAVVLAALFVVGLYLLGHSGHHSGTPQASQVTTQNKTSKKSVTPAKSQPSNHHKAHSPAPTSAALAPTSVSTHGNITVATYDVSSSPMTVSIDFSGLCWLGDMIDGAPQVQHTYNAGQSVSFSATSSLNLVFGTHSEAVTVNGQSVTPPSTPLLWEMNFVVTGGG